jgi:hypothetical protein
MTDQLDVLGRLIDYHDQIAPPVVPVADDVRRGRQRVRRNRAVVTGAVGLGVAGVVLTASLITGGDRNTHPTPAVSPPSGTATEKATDTVPDPVPENGRITSVQKHLGTSATDYRWRDFNSASDTGLFASANPCDDCAEEFDGLTVVGPAGPVSTLACPDALPCPPDEGWISYAATLGPGADEVTVESGDRTLQVIGYDGTVRRTLDLTAIPDYLSDIRKLAWSPDGGRLAIATAVDIWLVEGDGDPQLASSPGRIWSLGGWSPDGQSLLVDQYAGQTGADVVVLHLASDGSPAMTLQTLYRSDRHFDWAGNVAWSPDGTRIAVRTKNSIVEISAEDGSVLARHRHRDGWLIWPRGDR